MGIVAKSRLQSLLGLGGRVRAEGGLFAWAVGDRALCAAIASISGARISGIAGWRD
jgi:hypothetical protein